KIKVEAEGGGVVFEDGISIFEDADGRVVVGGSGSGGGAERKDDETDELWLKRHCDEKLGLGLCEPAGVVMDVDDVKGAESLR
ncbi:3538_t:CDS:2, partial [Paraglomus occultum]